MNLKLKENDLEKRQIILDAFRNGQTKFQARDKIVETFGSCTGYAVRTCERWFTKFRKGDFDLIDIPRDKQYKHRQNKDRSYLKRKRSTKKINQVDEVTFKQKDLPIPPSTNKKMDVANLIKKKRELTISKVSAPSTAIKILPSQPNIITKRLIPISSPPKLIPVTNNVNRIPLEMPKLRPRRPRSHGIQVQIPASAAKRLTPHTLTENHIIGQENRGSTPSSQATYGPQKNAAPKNVTVQFQNINPEIAKSTVYKSARKASKNENQLNTHLKRQNPIIQADKMLKISKVAHIESMSPEKNKKDEQTLPVPTSSPLNNPKGVIYLNPQEIFRQNFSGFGNVNMTKKRPNSLVKPVQPKIQQPPAMPITISTPPPEKQDSSIVLSDSDDTEEELVLPKNVTLPAPKIKTDTFITYWDMESGNPIPLNEEAQPILPKPTTSVIEID